MDHYSTRKNCLCGNVISSPTSFGSATPPALRSKFKARKWVEGKNPPREHTDHPGGWLMEKAKKCMKKRDNYLKQQQ